MSFVFIFWFTCFPTIVGVLLGRVIAKRFGTTKTRTAQLMVVIFCASWFLSAFQALYLHQGAILNPGKNVHAFGPDGANNEIWSQMALVWPLMCLGGFVAFWSVYKLSQPWKTYMSKDGMKSE